MIDLPGRGDAAMNLIGLILIAALSGGIVAVSLRLRASSTRLWIEADRLRPKDELSQGQSSAQASATKVGGGRWLADSFRIEGKALYHATEDQFRN